MYNYRILLQYDGGRYDGWQRLGKDNSTNTIEAKLKDILSKMTGEDVDIFCASRTEKGVHACGQIANFKLNTSQKDYELRNYLNRYLPRDIAVLKVEAVDDRFHSQLNAKARVYEYRLDTADIADVFNRRYCYHTFECLTLIICVRQQIILLENMILNHLQLQKRANQQSDVLTV